MRSLSNHEATIVVGLLVEQLGGEAILTAEQVARFDLDVESFYDPMTMQTRITASRKPEIIPGEIVTAEPQSIEPVVFPEDAATHQHEPWQVRRAASGGRFCAACGGIV